MNQNSYISKSLTGTHFLKPDFLSCASSTPLINLWKELLQIAKFYLMPPEELSYWIYIKFSGHATTAVAYQMPVLLALQD